MRKGLHVVCYVVAFVVATWALAAVPGAPPALGGPELFRALARPFVGATPARAHPPDLVGEPGAGEDGAALEALIELPDADAPLAQQSDDAGVTGPRPLPGFEQFLARLRALEQGARDKVRVLHLGDSEIVGDGVASALRDVLSERFGSGGLGFSLAMAPFAWYGRRGWEHREGHGFEAKSFVFGRSGDGAFGPGGVAFIAQGGGASALVRLIAAGEIAPLALGPSVPSPAGGPCTVSLHYWMEPGRGALTLAFDGKKHSTLSLVAARAHSAVYPMHFDVCPRKLELLTSGAGPHRVFGWSVERDAPGVVWSSLGMISAQLPHLDNYRDEALAEALAGLAPDLLVVAYCLNFNDNGIARDYAARARHALVKLRAAAPDAACLVTGPYPVGPPASADVDLPLRDTVMALDAAQREAALGAGCAYVDRIALAGGIDAVKRWGASRPALLGGDYRHLTPEGAERMGRALARVILAGVDGRAAAPVDPDLDLGRRRDAGP